MHVAVEATRLLTEKRGIGRYVRNVMQAMADVRPDIRYTLYARPAQVEALRQHVARLPGVAERARVEPLAKLRTTDADVAWHAWNWIRWPLFSGTVRLTASLPPAATRCINPR